MNKTRLWAYMFIELYYNTRRHAEDSHKLVPVLTILKRERRITQVRERIGGTQGYEQSTRCRDCRRLYRRCQENDRCLSLSLPPTVCHWLLSLPL